MGQREKPVKAGFFIFSPAGIDKIIIHSPKISL